MSNPSTFFCRTGSKKPIREIIKRNAPKDFSTYVEPFVGSGAILHYLYDPEKKGVINDIDKDLMSGYKLLKKGVSGDIERFDKMSLSSMNAFVDKPASSDLDRLAKRLMVSCLTFGTKGSGKLFKETNIYPKLKNLDKYKEFYKNVSMLSQDYKSVIRQYDSPTTFFYIDPPYEGSEEQRVYKAGAFSNEELAKVLKGIKGKFLLSMNDSPKVREDFKGFKIRGLTVRTQGKKGIGVKPRKEVLIKNY